MLSNARAHRDTVMQFRLANARIRQEDSLAVIGVGEKTRIRLTVRRLTDGPRFVISEDQFVNELGRHDGRTLETGDGTVPLAGALPPFLPETRLVCARDDDLEFLELRDRLLVGLGRLHGLLPRVNLVQRLVTRHLCPGYGGRVWGRRLPGIRSWNPPIAELAERRQLRLRRSAGELRPA